MFPKLTKLIKLSILFILLLAGYNTASASFTISRPSTNNLGLVGHWTFDGGKVVNGVALDSSGNGNNGNLINIATSTFYSIGKIGQGFNFDGTDDDAENTTIFTPDDNTEDYSVGGWFKADTITGWRGIAGWTSDTDDSEPYANLALKNDSKLHFWVRNDAGTTITDIYTDTLSSDTWYHAAGTKNGSVYRLYLNGVEATSTTATISGTFSSRNLFQTGAFNEGAVRNNYVFDGTIDDVRVYNRALSAGEIKNLYNQGVSKLNKTPTNILTNGLVGHWTFDGKNVVNGVALDFSGNGNNGNLVNIATSTFYSAGKLGQGFNFDGTDDYVDLGNPASLQITGAITLSVWVKFDTLNTVDDLIAKEGSPTDRGYRLVKEADGFVKCNVAVDATTKFIIGSATALTAGVWYHFVCVFTPSVSIAVFINGVQDAINTTSPPASQRNATVGPDIGTRDNSTEQGVDGVMDEVRVYNRALSAGEVKMLYNMGR